MHKKYHIQNKVYTIKTKACIQNKNIPCMFEHTTTAYYFQVHEYSHVQGFQVFYKNAVLGKIFVSSHEVG